jgi:hypothetical protein
MNPNKRPLAVTILGWLYIAVGSAGTVFHFPDLFAGGMFHYDGLLVEATELLAILFGLFVLRGQNWARWGALGWMAFHVILSATGAVREFVVHCVFFAVIAYFLFRADARWYFRHPRTEVV